MDRWIDGQDRERDRREFVYLNILFYSGWQISVYLHRNKQRSALKINTRNRFLSIRRLRWLRVFIKGKFVRPVQITRNVFVSEMLCSLRISRV